MTLNLNRAYKNKLSRLSGIPLDQIDYWLTRAFQRLNADPVKDVGLIVKVMKHMARKENLNRIAKQ